jgi:hypothetical protein
VDRFHAFSIARDLDGFIRFGLGVGRPAQPDDAVLVGSTLMLQLAGCSAAVCS